MESKKRKDKFWEILGKISICATIFGLLFNILTLFVIINSFDKTLSDVGHPLSQLKMAAKYESYHDYAEALSIYEKLIEKDGKYKYYAAYKMGNIYSEKYSDDINDYKNAWKNYMLAIESNDIDILKRCLSFVVEQYRLNNGGKNESSINILDNSNPSDADNGKSNIEIVQDLLNNINNLDPNFSNLFPIEFPISSGEQLKQVFDDEWISKNNYKWVYVSTKISENGAEAFIDSNEKLELIGSFQKLIDDNSFSTVTLYKYNLYQRAEETNNGGATGLEIIENYCKNRNEPKINL